MAIAISDSVTVSMAALSSGTLSLMFLVSRVLTSTCAGSTVEWRGTSRMSSKVSAVRRSAPMAFVPQFSGLSHLCFPARAFCVLAAFQATARGTS